MNFISLHDDAMRRDLCTTGNAEKPKLHELWYSTLDKEASTVL